MKKKNSEGVKTYKIQKMGQETSQNMIEVNLCLSTFYLDDEAAVVDIAQRPQISIYFYFSCRHKLKLANT